MRSAFSDVHAPENICPALVVIVDCFSSASLKSASGGFWLSLMIAGKFSQGICRSKNKKQNGLQSYKHLTLMILRDIRQIAATELWLYTVMSRDE